MSKQARLNYLILGIVACTWLSTFWGVWIAYPVTVSVVGALTLIMNLHAMDARTCRGIVVVGYERDSKCILSDGHPGDCRDFRGNSREEVLRW